MITTMKKKHMPLQTPLWEEWKTLLPVKGHQWEGPIPSSIWIVIDSGVKGKTDVTHRLQATITPSTQYTHQADGSSPLHVSGKTRLCLLIFEGLVVDILVFMMDKI
jgi:hypothetical protein